MTEHSDLKQQHVLWLNHFVPYPAKGGLLIRTHGLLECVTKAHKVTLVCLIQPRLLTPYFNSVEQGLAEAKTFYENRGVEVHFFEMPAEKSTKARLWTAFYSLFSARPYSVNWLRAPKCKVFLKRLLKERTFDFIHVDTMGLIDHLPREQRFECPVVINHHNAEHAMMERRAQKESNILKRWYYQLEARKIACFDADRMQKYQRHIVCSAPDGQALKALNSKIETSVVPNGVPFLPEVKRTPIKGQLLFIGGLDWYPNTDAITFLLRDVCPMIIDRGLDVKIDIIGKNPSEEITALAQRYDFIEIHGYVDDISIFYAQAQAFLCPLRDGGGTKLKVLDAMNHGLPVIGTDIAFEGIAIQDGASGFKAESANEICDTIEKLLNSAAELDLVGVRARKLIKDEYDSHAISQNYTEFIQSSAAKRQ
ncbi:glycosyltransferase family 4 protein [Alteromonas sp. ASW11-36]|uniref:Glycosyltransferase family 4 protein n=1 Tax=Alteromonas arenosi TaxID=3055817 RepID=A0ABT7STX1_9ALTE|nr:glycosyltransferase family 4 protein [Alteromonas sp. ASW11-36]MDM7859647.1 glycosyltransferase family 4 protein [Alteromonas sp. ASW11-36]